jgi:pantothenate kinase type III
MLEVPRTEADAVPAGPLGRNTRDAMLLGAIEAVRGLSHRMIDRYAEVEGGYPRVIATGGDAALLFREDDLIEHIVPDLVLIGMQTAWIRSEFPGAFEGQEAGGFEDDELDDGDDFGDPMTDERP